MNGFQLALQVVDRARCFDGVIRMIDSYPLCYPRADQHFGYTGFMAFDMHTHSDRSDGTQTPTELIRAASHAGLSGIALTDHDTTAGWDQAAQAASEYGIALIRGMEISCATAEGISVHLLSYLHDPTDEALLAEIGRARDARLTRAQEMTARLAEDYPIDWELVLDHVGKEATVGRPHIADALVAAGVVATRSDAFSEILVTGSKYYIPHYAPDPALAVELVRGAGGVPVFAHPMAVKRGRVVKKCTFNEMIEAGLAGLEVYHRDNPLDARQDLLEMANKHQLLVTGSSDYHGAGKPNQLGENTTDRSVVEAIAEQATSSTAVLWNGH